MQVSFNNYLSWVDSLRSLGLLIISLCNDSMVVGQMLPSCPLVLLMLLRFKYYTTMLHLDKLQFN